jgi:RNA polymerase sigma-70 factor, ECF subfamily
VTSKRHNADEELLCRLKEGDPQALATVFSRNRRWLLKLVERRLDTRLTARVSPADVLQETFIDALKRLRHFQADPDVPFSIWLRTVAIQRLIEVHRQHLGAKARDADREVPLAIACAYGTNSERIAARFVDLTSPSEKLERAEIIAIVRQALDRLDPIDREVLALRHFEELDNREVAALLGILPAAASKRHVRALERFRKEVARSMAP